MKPRGPAVGSLRILAQIGLEMLDRPGEVARLLAGLPHREKKLGTKRGALGQTARLGQ